MSATVAGLVSEVQTKVTAINKRVFLVKRNYALFFRWRWGGGAVRGIKDAPWLRVN